MTTLVLSLNSVALANPDLDIRYVLPDLLAERSGGAIEDDGYDYADDPRTLLLFLRTTDLNAALACIRDVIENVPVLGNDLRPATVVAVKRPKGYEVVYPVDYRGSIPVTRDH
jgi:hypothetical protein